MMEHEKSNNLLFSDKRNRETRLRRSVVSIDDTDYLMEVRSVRRCSIGSMTNDDIDISSKNGADWNQVWKNFTTSRDNIRNMVPLDKGKNGGISEDTSLPDLIDASADDSYNSKSLSSSNSSSSLSALTTSSSASPVHHSNTIADAKPAWYNILGAMSRRERQQRKAYHDALDERHEATTTQDRRKNKNHPYYQYWHRRKSSRDGLDFSRDVTLALRHASIYAMADSLTLLPPADTFDCNEDVSDRNNNHQSGDYNNAYFQDTRPATNPKTKKCVLDLVA